MILPKTLVMKESMKITEKEHFKQDQQRQVKYVPAYL